MNIENPHRPGQAHGDINKKKLPEVGVEQAQKQELLREPRESRVAYLWRAADLVTQKTRNKTAILFDHARTQENDLPKDIRIMIENIIAEALKPKEDTFDPSKNEAVIKYIEGEDVVRFHDKSGPANSTLFDKTQRNRKFFEIQPGKGAAKCETYWNTLFFPYNTEITRKFAKKTLDDKIIVLLGGGRSKIREELQKHNITPRKIVNVDPFVENIEEGADSIIPLSASDENFIEKMREQGIESADEIWAEYSVPAYLEDPKEIRQLIQNIDALLATGGLARIWPIEVGFGSGKSSELIERKNALTESLKNIRATNKYEFVLYKSAGRHGLVLHKLTPTKEEL